MRRYYVAVLTNLDGYHLGYIDTNASGTDGWSGWDRDHDFTTDLEKFQPLPDHYGTIESVLNPKHYHAQVRVEVESLDPFREGNVIDKITKLHPEIFL